MPDPNRRPEPEAANLIGRPACCKVGPVTGRLAHHQPSSGSQEADRALSRHRGSPEEAGHDHIRVAAEVGFPRERLGATAAHTDSRPEVEPINGVLEELATLLACV